MPRNIIRLAGSNYERIKALTGVEVLQNREVVISKDTSELYVGKENGELSLLGNVHIGQKFMDIQEVAPEKGRLFYNDGSGILYVGNGSGWRRVGYRLAHNSGLMLDELTGELRVNVDSQTIKVNESGKLETNHSDYQFLSSKIERN